MKKQKPKQPKPTSLVLKNSWGKWDIQNDPLFPFTPKIQSELLRFFEYKHLPTKLKKVSKPFHEMALMLDKALPYNAEKTVALRKLLEAKDCAVRSVL